MTTATKQPRKTWRDNPPSERATSYLTDLVRKHQAGHFGTGVEEDLRTLTHWFAQEKRTAGDVSDMIDKVKARPKRGPGPAPAPAAPAKPAVPFTPVPEVVPSSKFAILTELLTEAPDPWRKQEYLFFEVKKLPRKDARVISRLTGAPGRFTRSRLPYGLRAELLGHLEDPAFAYQAALTFAEVYEVCGRCAAELTDTDSRERKFGLHCWNLMAPYRDAAGL